MGLWGKAKLHWMVVDLMGVRMEDSFMSKLIKILMRFLLFDNETQKRNN